MKALLVNVDLMFRVIVPDDATAEQIIAAAVAKGLAEVNRDPSEVIGENVAEWKDDTVIPYGEMDSDAGVIIGYQIESTDGSHNIPHGLFSFEVFSTHKKADKWLDNNDPMGSWKIIPVHDGDVEGVTYVGEPVTE